MENKQTAVEWLAEQLLGIGIKDCPNGIIEQAKEMEKEQIIDAHGDEQSHLEDDGSWRTVTVEQYYNETYGKQTDRS